jgi:hypothetical protein
MLAQYSQSMYLCSQIQLQECCYSPNYTPYSPWQYHMAVLHRWCPDRLQVRMSVMQELALSARSHYSHQLLLALLHDETNHQDC